MSITTVNMTYFGNGPTVTGEVLASATGASPVAKTLKYFADVTLDGSSTSFNLNYIDGTATINTPKAITAFISNSPATAAAATVYVQSTTSHNASTGQDDYATVTISAADSNGHKIRVVGEILYAS